jgi:hypothetical protein
MLFKMVAGLIFSAATGEGAGLGERLSGAFNVELMFIGLAALSILTAFAFRRGSVRNPGLGLDAPARQ